MPYKTINRAGLKRKVEAGQYEIKCDLHLTDDYQFDNANGFGKTEWLPARIRRPIFEEVTLQNGFVTSHCKDGDYKEGFINLDESDFEGKPGHAYMNEETGLITLHIHSNLYYSLRPVKA